MNTETVKDDAERQSPSNVGLDVTVDELRIICDATVRLTELRQRGCEHLCIENVAPEIMRKLLFTLRSHKKGMVNINDVYSTGWDSFPDTPNV